MGPRGQMSEMRGVRPPMWNSMTTLCSCPGARSRQFSSPCAQRGAVHPILGPPAKKEASRGFEPRSLDSESRVLTVTPRGRLTHTQPGAVCGASSCGAVACQLTCSIHIATFEEHSFHHSLYGTAARLGATRRRLPASYVPKLMLPESVDGAPRSR